MRNTTFAFLLWAMVQSAVSDESVLPHVQDDAPPDDRLTERNELAWEVMRLRDAGMSAKAVSTVSEMLVVEREIFGDHHEDLAGALEWSARDLRTRD